MFGTRDVTLSPVAPAATAFTTLADVKTALGVSGSGEDTRITALMLAAASLIEGYCGGILAQRTVTEIADAEEAMTVLVLQHGNLQSLTSLAIDDVAQTVGDFRALKLTGMLRRVDGAAMPKGKYTVVYVAGYAAGSIPGPIIEAAIQLTKALYNSKGVPVGVKAESVEDVGSVTYGGADAVRGENGVALPLDVASLLGAYVTRVSP